ncbi:hypothetical protein FQN50_001925 [Emmonsiellopsis sp. PD_5]|nr:hypothetical protein FQN50_001925 [Emmonsiellopsis sp. PD_5]
MKVTTALLTFGLALGVVSEPIHHRDLAAFTGIISDIGAGVDALSSALSGGDNDAAISASEDLVASIKAGVETAKGEDELTLNDALSLTSPVQELIEKVDGVIDTIIKKKEDFIAADLAFLIKQSLSEQFDASTALAEAISSKVPEGVKDIAKQLAAGVSDSIQKGIKAYEDVTEGGNGGSKPTKTAEPTGEPTAEPTGKPTDEPTADPTGGYPTPEPTPTATPSGPIVTPPPEFTGAAVMNGQNVVGVLAAAAAVLAF